MTQAGTKKSKLIFLASYLLLLLANCQVSARPNSSHDTGRATDGMVLRSHKGKRAWDLPFASETQDDPVLSVVDETEEGTSDNSGSEQNGESLWLDIGKNFVESKQISRNTDGELECEAVGSPPPKVYWMKDGVPIESMTIVTSNDESVKNRIEVGNNVIYDKFGSTGMANVKARLPIKCAQPGDEGQYKCVAINRGKEVSATTYLSVIDEANANAPRGSCDYRLSSFSFKKARKGSSAFIISSETFHMETMGRHIALPCRNVGKPRPQVTWLDQDKKKIVSGKKYQVSSSGSLIIRNLAWKDMGVYTCIVENLFGRDSTTTFVYPLLDESQAS